MDNRWREQTLGEVCYITDGAHSKVKRESHGVMYLTSKNIGNGNLKLDDFDYISEESHNKLFTDTKKSQRRLKAGDVLMGIIGTFGNCYVYKESDRFGISSSVAILRPNQELLIPEYLFYVISSKKFKAIVEKFKGGSVQGYTNISTIKALPIKIPPIEVQREIVSQLIPCDKKIELNQQTTQTLEQMAQALFKSWFVDFDPVVDNALAAGNPIPDELAHRVEVRKKAHALADFQLLPEHIRNLFPSEFEQTGEPSVGINGWVPKGWDIKPINKVGEIVCGKTPSKSNPDFYGEDVPFIKIPDMHGNMLITETSDSLSYEGDSSQPKKRIPKNSICVSCIATVGLVSITTEPSHTNQQINSIVPIDTAQVEYLYFQMKGLNKKFHDLASGGSATLNMNTRTFGSIDILVPNQVVINEFHNRVSSLVSKIELCKRESEQLASIRDSLLPKLISGEIQLQPASKNIQEAELQGV